MATKPALRAAELPPEQLRWVCDPQRIPYETTAQAEPIEGPVGQSRALRALRMGVELEAPGYNVFVCGLSGTSRGGMIHHMIEEIQPRNKSAPDRCYVNNFKSPDRARLLILPRGQANGFKKDMQSGIEFLRRRVPQVFEGEPFQRQKEPYRGALYGAREGIDGRLHAADRAREQFALGHMQSGRGAAGDLPGARRPDGAH